jgi:hypothetical protein
MSFDPSGPDREARSLTGQLQSELTAGLARTLGSVPDHRVHQAMRTPLRRPVLDALFWGLPRVLADTRADEITSLVHFHVTGRADGRFDAFRVEYVGGRWEAARGTEGTGDPELTITVDAGELVLIAFRRSSPLQAYLSGRLRASGNPVVAARLTMLLRGLQAQSAHPRTSEPERS